MKSLVSIIIPVYNVEKHIEKCILSLRNQTHENIEIILVDDGSTDNSGKLCDKHAQADSRLRVFHKANSGSSDARNMGLDRARGDYIMFVDADDFIAKNMVEKMLARITQDVDIVVCNFSTTDIHTAKLDSDAHILSATEALENLMYQRFITCSPWAKLYKAGLFDDIRFPSGKINQDFGTTYKVFAKTRKVILFDEKMYAYTYRPESVINSNFSPKRMAGLEFAIEEYAFVKANFPIIEKAALNRLFAEGMFILQRMSIQDIAHYKGDYAQCKNIVIQTRGVVLRDGKSSLKYRAFAMLSYVDPTVLVISGGAVRAVKKLKRGLASLKNRRQIES